MKFYNYIKRFMKDRELADIPNIVKIFDNPDTTECYTCNVEKWVHPANYIHIKPVYLGSEVFDHHLLIEWANKILTNHYHTLDIVEYKKQHYFEIKLQETKQENVRILTKIPYDLTRVIDLSYELDKKYANDSKIENTYTIYYKTPKDTTKTQSDPVNSPTHYQTGLIETIDSIKNILGHEKFQAYCIGNVIKYLSRYREKNGLEDLKKAETYISFIIKSYKECTTQ